MQRALIDVTQALICGLLAGFIAGFVNGFAAAWRGVPLVMWYNQPLSSSGYWSGLVINFAVFAALMIPISLRRNRSAAAGSVLTARSQASSAQLSLDETAPQQRQPPSTPHARRQAGVINYVGQHWRGELSLARSYWVNTFLPSFLVAVGGTALEEWLAQQSLENVAIGGLAFLLFAAVVTVWQFVGVWRSATNTSIKTGHGFWPGVAKAAVVLGTLGATVTGITTSIDLVNVYAAAGDPTLTEYSIERRGDTDLILSGAINEKSAEEVISALRDPSIEILRINSHGGLVYPAVGLARHIQENDVMVMAEGECISACVMLLAASPYAAIYPGTEVTFHRSEPVVDFTNPQTRAENDRYMAETDEIFREFGISEWAIETAGRQQFWTPTVAQQIEMGLIIYIYDLDQDFFMPADEYCAEHREFCSE